MHVCLFKKQKVSHTTRLAEVCNLCHILHLSNPDKMIYAKHCRL